MFFRSLQFLYRMAWQAEICFGILLKMKLSFSTQSKMANSVYVAASSSSIGIKQGRFEVGHQRLAEGSTQ
jgi:hypothetical protein